MTTRALLAALLLATPALAQVQARAVGRDAAGEPIVRLSCDDAPLAEVVLALSRAARRTVVAAPAERVTLAVEGPWREVAARVAEAARARVEPLGERALRLTPAPRVTGQFSYPASARTVAQLVAAYAGLDLVLAEGPSARVAVQVREVDALDLLHALARAQRVPLGRSGEVVVVGRSTLPPAPAPRPAGRGPLRPAPAVHAVQAPAAALLTLLGALADAPLVVAGDALDGDPRASLEWPEGAACLDAVERVAAERGWALEQVGAVWLVGATGATPRPAEDPDERRRGRVIVPGREAPLRPALQAIVRATPPQALIDGRPYEPGDTLLDPDTDEEVEAVRLVEVGAREVTLEVQGGGQVRLRLE